MRLKFFVIVVVMAALFFIFYSKFANPPISGTAAVQTRVDLQAYLIEPESQPQTLGFWLEKLNECPLAKKGDRPFEISLRSHKWDYNSIVEDFYFEKCSYWSFLHKLSQKTSLELHEFVEYFLTDDPEYVDGHQTMIDAGWGILCAQQSEVIDENGCSFPVLVLNSYSFPSQNEVDMTFSINRAPFDSLVLMAADGKSHACSFMSCLSGYMNKTQTCLIDGTVKPGEYRLTGSYRLCRKEHIISVEMPFKKGAFVETHGVSIRVLDVKDGKNVSADLVVEWNEVLLAKELSDLENMESQMNISNAERRKMGALMKKHRCIELDVDIIDVFGDEHSCARTWRKIQPGVERHTISVTRIPEPAGKIKCKIVTYYREPMSLDVPVRFTAKP